MKAIDNLEEAGPKISDSSDILRITLLTISPKYIPDIIFSKPYSKNLTSQSCSFNYYQTTKSEYKAKKSSPDHLDWDFLHLNQYHMKF